MKGAQEAPSRSNVNLGAQMVSPGPGPGPGHQRKWTWRFGDSDFMRWYFTAQVLQLKSPLLFSLPGLAVHTKAGGKITLPLLVCPQKLLFPSHVPWGQLRNNRDSSFPFCQVQRDKCLATVCLFYSYSYSYSAFIELE